MSDLALENAQAVLDREQVAFLGDTPERARMSAWFNACLNSGCGPIKDRYGDAAVWALLHLWTEEVRVRAEAAEGKRTA